MKRHPVILAALFTTLLAVSLMLAGCGKKSADDSAAVSSAAGPSQYSSTVPEDDDQEEDTSYYSITIDNHWGNYEVTTNEIDYNPGEDSLDKDGYYTSEEEVAIYIIEYGTLPDNFITKKEARSLGWNGGGLDDYAEDCCIGGDYFRNNEGLLPVVEGRTYYECDIDTMNARKRGAKRIVYSNDGQIYYTDDHYESFTLIYGTDDYP